MLAGGASARESRMSSIVIDANTGAVVHAANPDVQRFPASLTKVMTLYLLFEQLEAGRVTLDTEFKVSAHASRQPPTKLGLDPGDTIRVEDAILSIVTLSANDMAVAIAENLAGSEEAFAERMTRRAHQLGMSRTVFRNASGLPNPEQHTTARDMATLGRAIYERFPNYSKYFSRRSFTYEGSVIRNHNHLLGRVDGVDGIKTGYTRASGFNLITSAHLDGRHLIAAVMGGTTSAQRDAQMRQLVARHLPNLSPRKTDFTMAQRVRGLGSVEPVAVARNEPRDEEETQPQAAMPPPRPAQQQEPPRLAAMPQPPTTMPQPIVVAQAAPPQVAPQPVDAPRRELTPAGVVRSAAAGPVLQWQTGPQPAQTNQARDAVEEAATASIPRRAPQVAAAIPAPTPLPAPIAPPPVAATPQSAPTPQQQAALTGWVVQIAAANSETEAQRILRAARESAGPRLSHAQPLTERVQKGASTLYRARFAGFADKSAADAACAVLKRNDYDCMAIRL